MVGIITRGIWSNKKQNLMFIIVGTITLGIW